MKTFINQAAQGDLLFVRVEALPNNLTTVPAESNGTLIIGHSETGHHHVIEADKVTMYRLPDEIYECSLVVHEPANLLHLRSFDTHETILVPPGTYRVRRQRERAYTPEGWRQAQD